MTDAAPADTRREIVHRTTGQNHGPVVRLMSPGDLGRSLKPFVFLDLFDAGSEMGAAFGLHPHSGIATITVLTEGDLVFAGPAAGCGRLGYGGVEWMRASNGVWHGNEMTPGTSKRVRGFQLWIALPAETENAAVDAQYLEAAAIPEIGGARLILGRYAGASSPVRSPYGINYLLVSLRDGEQWTYDPPKNHRIAWLCVSKGELIADSSIGPGEMAIFAPGEGAIDLVAKGETCFVFGSAIPHPHDLHLGHYSVHTSGEALRRGEANIAAIRPV